jgi:hypothetical protein
MKKLGMIVLAGSWPNGNGTSDAFTASILYAIWHSISLKRFKVTVFHTEESWVEPNAEAIALNALMLCRVI